MGCGHLPTLCVSETTPSGGPTEGDVGGTRGTGVLSPQQGESGGWQEGQRDASSDLCLMQIDTSDSMRTSTVTTNCPTQADILQLRPLRRSL